MQKTVPIAILDFGSQYTQLIARRLREANIYAEIFPFSQDLDTIRALAPKGIILSGGPASVYAKDAFFCDAGVFELGVPLLGICYGMQLIAHHFGGEVLASAKQEYGKTDIEITSSDSIFRSMEHYQSVFMSHSDKVTKIPAGFKKIAHSSNSDFAAIENKEKNIYAIQFHPEVAHTPNGAQILKNFAINVCGVSPDWTMKNFLETQTAALREKIGSAKVLCALSGGVDSSVTALLLHRAIGEQLVPVFVDNGLLRKNEAQDVERLFKKTLKIPLVTIKGEDYFLGKLRGVRDPEQKRKLIGAAFIELFEEEAKKHSGVKFLAQGTLYPDIIESTSVKGPSKTIKSHHNVGGLPEKMNLDLVEPLRELFKDEVRRLGKELGLSNEMLLRHPFPGPGLAVRILGEVSKPSCDLLREADNIFISELKKEGLYGKVWQAFAVLLNVQSVGVMGDNRTYENTVALRAVNSFDAMTAKFSHLPFEFLERVSTKIINEVKGINRVVYDISSKPPATIEWE